MSVRAWIRRRADEPQEGRNQPTPMTRQRLYADDFEPDEWAERCERFADPGGESALHPSSARNPRNLPCPTCGEPDRLTPADRAKGYQCDACADRDERGGY